MIGRRTPLAVCALVLLLGGHGQSQTVPQTDAARHVEINSASIATLRAALGISQEEASQIAARRPYQSMEQFRTKSGLTASEVDRLAPLITVQPAGPVRQPRLPPGAVPISPDTFKQGSSSSVPHDGSSSRGPGTTPVPVPPGTVQRVPVPPGTVQRSIPVPPPERVRTGPRDLRGAFVYGLFAVVVAIAALIYMRRTSPKRKTGHS